MKPTLDLEGHSLINLPDKFINKEQSITSLNLSNIFISSSSDLLLTGLRSLNLSHNMLASFSFPLKSTLRGKEQEEKSSSACLEKLDLSHNVVWSISPLPSTLTELDLSYNAIETMPKQLEDLTNLRVLSLQYNPICGQGTQDKPRFLLTLLLATIRVMDFYNNDRHIGAPPTIQPNFS